MSAQNALAIRDRLPGYFRDRYWSTGWDDIDWDCVEDEPILRMLSSGEAALLSLYAELEDRPGAVRILEERLGGRRTFTARLWMLDPDVRAVILDAAMRQWCAA